MFTNDDLETGKALHRKWKQAREARVQFANAKRTPADALWAHCAKMEGQTKRFWLRRGEDVLAALEEARKKLDWWGQLWEEARNMHPRLEMLYDDFAAEEG